MINNKIANMMIKFLFEQIIGNSKDENGSGITSFQERSSSFQGDLVVLTKRDWRAFESLTSKLMMQQSAKEKIRGTQESKELISSI